MMPFAAAQQAVIDTCRSLATEYVALAACAGRIVARDIIARDDLVPFARSAMDGYAVSCADVVSLPLTLPIADSVYAAPGTRVHQRATATAIATGAAIPAGADCVIPFEDVGVDSGTITLTRGVNPGACIFPPGDDACRGDVLLARGAPITPPRCALLAAAGIMRVEVYRRPRVTVICGGDELVAVDRSPAHGQIRDSNGFLLATALTAAGANVAPPLRLRDNRESILATLVQACEASDLVITTGGASVGERDYVKGVCTDIGVDFCFREVDLRPAKPTAFGRRGEAVIAVLPGNPAAAFVALQEFVNPAVRALAGHLEPRLARISATLTGSLHAKPGRHFAAFAAVAAGCDGFHATLLANQCSSLTRTAADAAGLIIVPPGPRSYSDGDRVDVDVFDWTQVGVLHSARTLQDRLALV